MSRRRLRFIHSSDWHLESPLGGLANVPERLRGPFLDAPYRAAERVVAAALAEQADFVVLAGDIIDVELAGPHGIDFLRRQFTRLAERQIPVYWAGGRVDRPERWPAALPLPENVHRFSSRRPHDFVFEAGNAPQARLTGLSRPRGGKIRAADFWPDPDGLPTIAVAHGRVDRAALAARGLTYWALGGKHRRTTLLETPHAAEYAGSTQARGPAETGSSSCTAVEIDEEGAVHARPISTDVVRWHTRRVVVGDATTAEALEGLLIEQLNDLCRGTPGLHLLVSWTVQGTGPLIATLRRGKRTTEILARLRRRYEAENPVVWPLGLEVEAEAAVPPAWLEQDSLLGDYLRSLVHFDGRVDTTVADLVGPLRDLAGRHPAAADLECLIGLSDVERRKVLQKAAALGADLLTCEEARP
ncbi:MAG TPA: metallophosphoesterase [Pirellulales bacterium]|nr:metallophosphoesterase [Pirellulales bacterium]